MPALVRHALLIRGREALAAAAMAAAYFLIAGASMAAFGTNTPIWFANAAAVAILVQQKRSAWPLFLGMQLLADSLAIALAGSGPVPLLAAADIFETGAVAWAIGRLGGPVAILSSPGGLARFVGISLLVPLASASWGGGILAHSEGAPALPAVWQWYKASALGMLVVSPILLIWLSPALRGSPPRRDWLEMSALALGLALLAMLVFETQQPAFLFILFPALLLLVWRHGLLGASTGSALVVAIGLACTLAGGSSISVLVYPLGIRSEIEALQILLGALSLSSLPLAVVLADQRRLTKELARVAEARRDFLAAMSHEIRTPMTGILGIVDLFEGEQPTPKQRSYLDSIRSSGRHLLAIINDILDFSRIESGHIDLEHIDFSLPRLLEQLRSLLHPLAHERGLALRLDLAEGSPPAVRGDPTRLRQILLNLAGNALKFTPEGEVIIAVGCQPLGTGRYRFSFEVRDTGIGIAADKLDSLFSAFSQADHSTSRRFGGSGLGLAISRRLVEAMGGTISVASTPGKGSAFRFELELPEGDPEASPGGESAALPAPPSRILLVEDVELNREIIRTMLERDGHAVEIAVDGVEAVARAGGDDFDVILMDVHMPLMDGLDATRRIRSLDGPRGKVPIVAITADVMAAEQERCLRAGMDGFLMKPVDWDRVRQAIARHSRTSVGAMPGVASPAFDRAAFDRLAAVLPPERQRAFARELELEVAVLAASPLDGDREALGEQAHRLVSQAGMLGLSRLSELAAEVEDACRSGGDLCSALARFTSAARDIDLLPLSLRAERKRRAFG
ncbi:MAG TPA: ATP-binding protein [Sphingomicrobium sp.]|nr:ATP-binding protein [Sphingomicrobium sp.]